MLKYTFQRCILQPMRPTLKGCWKGEKAKLMVGASGFTRAHIAKQCGISVRTLTQILNGQTPSLSLVKLLAQVLGCSEAELLCSNKEEAS